MPDHRVRLAGDRRQRLERRRRLRYPPFSHLLRVVPRAESEADLERTALALAASLRERLPGEADLLGPAPMFRVRGKHRRRLLVKADDRESMVAATREAVETLAADRRLAGGVAISVDVDPQ